MQPFLKWAGGKRWLFSPEFIENLPPFTRYIEPFLGGGAGFFCIEPKKSLVSDLNADLITMYECIRDDYKAIVDRLQYHQEMHSQEHYYATRGQMPETRQDQAARFLYLNRTCWNGLYRLNLRGEFNVPIGSKDAVMLPTDDFKYASQLLSNAIIKNCDFEETIAQATEGDLVFADPPYTVAHNNNGFIKYNEKIFSWGDQIRLRDALRAAKSRGAKVIVTNAYHESVRDLYSDGFTLHEVPRQSVISGQSRGRKAVSELLVTI